MDAKIMVSREKRGLGYPDARRLILRAINAALRAEGVGEECEISVLLTDNEGIHALNREYRNVDRPTDVLSFPANELTPGEFDAQACEEDPETGRIFLGDMAISLENARRRAWSTVTASRESSCTSPSTARCICWATTTWTRQR